MSYFFRHLVFVAYYLRVWFCGFFLYFVVPNRMYTKKTPARCRRSVDNKITYETVSIQEIKNHSMDTMAIEQQGRRIKLASS